MNCDVCCLFRGDIRYDTRLSNLVHTLNQAGKTCFVIQGAGADETFDVTGAQVQSFRNLSRGPRGFVEYWRKAGGIASGVNATLWWAAELYSLPLAVRRARATRGRSCYDAREIFSHLASLEHRPLTQWFWRLLERRYIKLADGVVTTGEMDADFLADRYRIERPLVVRNLPRYRSVTRTHRLHDLLAIPHEMPICLYSGGLFEGRGIPSMLAVAAQIPQAAFVFLGSGPFESAVAKAKTKSANVYHLPAIPNDQMIDIAASATIGFALIEPISLSYRYALPNKLFEYIMAGAPVMVSDMPQMCAIVEKYSVGTAVAWGSIEDTVAQTRLLLNDQSLYRQCAGSCLKAAQELCWDKEAEAFIAYARARGLLL